MDRYLSPCKAFEFVFGFRLMALKFVVFQVVPHLFVRVPVWRIRRKIKYMETSLAFDIRLGLLRCMRPGLIHHHDKVATRKIGRAHV